MPGIRIRPPWNFPVLNPPVIAFCGKHTIGGVFRIGALRRVGAGQGGSEFGGKEWVHPTEACADPRIEVFQGMSPVSHDLMKNRPR